MAIASAEGQKIWTIDQNNLKGTLTISDVALFTSSFLSKFTALITSFVSAYQAITSLLGGTCTSDLPSLIFMIGLVSILSIFIVVFALVFAPTLFSIIFGAGVLFILEDIDRTCNV